MSSQQMSVILSGDALITRPFRDSRDPAMMQLVELIRNADVRFTNFEMLINEYGGTPAVEAGGLHLSASKRVAEDLLWAGFNLFATANNHSLDFGVDGLLLHIIQVQELHKTQQAAAVWHYLQPRLQDSTGNPGAIGRCRCFKPTSLHTSTHSILLTNPYA